MPLWFKCNPIDFLDGFEGLENEAQCALYAAVVFRIYASGGPVPYNPASLGALVHMTRLRAVRVLERLIELGKLQLVDGRLFNARAETELESLDRVSAARAKAGSIGGSRSKPGRNSANSEQNASKSHANRSQIDSVSRLPSAENRETDQAIASPRARDQTRPKQKETPSPLEASTPKLQRHPVHLPTRMPDFADRSGSEEEDLRFGGVDVRALQSRILSEARIVVPPNDLALVEGWLALGADPEKEIMPTVARMAATSRTPVRAVRYFDAEIRRIVEVRKAKDADETAKFNRIAARSRA